MGRFYQETYRTCTNFGALPSPLRKWSYFHNTSVFAPVFHIRAVAYINITERSMSIITWTAKHSIFPINFLREKDTVAVERKACFLALEEFLEIECISDAYCRTIISIAPGNPISILYPCYTRVVLVFRLNHISISAFKNDRVMFYLPIYPVFTESGKDIHLNCFIIAAENTCKTFLEFNYSTIKDTIR